MLAKLFIDTGMYVACEVSRHSEWDAFSKAVAMLGRVGAAVKSVRLDKYLNTRKVIRMFDPTVSLFVIPKRTWPVLGLGRILWCDDGFAGWFSV